MKRTTTKTITYSLTVEEAKEAMEMYLRSTYSDAYAELKEGNSVMKFNIGTSDYDRMTGKPQVAVKGVEIEINVED